MALGQTTKAPDEYVTPVGAPVPSMLPSDPALAAQLPVSAVFFPPGFMGSLASAHSTASSSTRSGTSGPHPLKSAPNVAVSGAPTVIASANAPDTSVEEPSAIAQIRNGVTTRTTAYIALSGLTPGSPFTTTNRYHYADSIGNVNDDAFLIPTQYTQTADPVLAQNASISGVNPLATYAVGIAFNRDARGDAANPSSLRVWQSNDGGRSWSGIGSEADVLPDNSTGQTIDKPWIMVSQHPNSNGFVYVAWVRAGISTAIGQICFRRSTNGVLQPHDQAWDDLVVVDERAGVTGPQIVEDNDGYVYVVWNSFDFTRNQFVIWAARSLQPAAAPDASGHRFSAAQQVTTFNLLGDLQLHTQNFLSNPSLFALTLVSAAFDSVNNRIVLAWHEGETPGSAHSDIRYAYATPSASPAFTTLPAPINTTGADQFKPALSTDETGTVLMTYYDRARLLNGQYAEVAALLTTTGTLTTAVAPDANPTRVGTPCTTYTQIGEYQGSWHTPYTPARRWDLAWACGDSDTDFTGGSRTIVHAVVSAPSTDCAISVSVSPTLSASRLSFPSTGGVARIYIATGASCIWSASASDPSISLSALSGTGTGTLDLSLAVNPGPQGRTVTVTIGGHTITLTQAAPPPACSAAQLTLSPIGGFYPSVGGAATVQVTTTAPCSWSAAVETTVDWVHLKAPAAGVGSGSLSFTIDSNDPAQTAETLPRYAHIRFNGLTPLTYVVNQLGATAPPCPVDTHGVPTFALVGPSAIVAGQYLSLAAYAGPGFTYRWTVTPSPDPSLSGVIPGSAPAIFLRPGNAYYPVLPQGVPMTYTYSVTVSSPACPDGVKQSFTVHVDPAPAGCPLPQFDSGPGGVIVTNGIGHAVHLSVEWLIPPNPMPEFQWFKGVEGDERTPVTDPITGQLETSRDLTVAPNVDSKYWVRLRNTFCANGQVADQWSGTALIIVGLSSGRIRPARHNFSTVGTTDLMLRNVHTGSNALLPINPTAPAALSLIALPSFAPPWQAQTISDLNGDGRPDIVWRNPSTGENAYWPMSGTTVLATTALESHDTDWFLAGTGDFLATGNMALLWQNRATNEIEMWVMAGTRHAGSFSLGYVPSADWKLQGAADLDGDSKPDLFFRNYRTGENVIWHMDGPVPPGFAPVGSHSSALTAAVTATTAHHHAFSTSDGMRGTSIDALPDTTWRVASIDDADGDGVADILWINAVSGELMFWKMGGNMLHVATVSLPPQTDPTLTIAGTPPIEVAPTAAATTLSVSPATATYSTVATIDGMLLADGVPVVGATVSVLIDGSAVGTTLTRSDGTFSLSAAVAGIATGTHTISAHFSGDALSAPSSATAPLQIEPQPTQLTWPAPAAIGYGTALSVAQLNAGSTVPGTFTYAPPSGTILDAGLHQLTVSFVPADANYAGATASTTITINQAAQTITWPPPANLVYGTPLSANQLNASVNVVGPAPAGAMTYDPPIGTLFPAGDYLLTVTAAETLDYARTTASVLLHVTPATPSITWPAPAPITYGTPLSTTHLNATANVPGTLTYAPAPGTVLAAGAHVLTVLFTPTDTTNYASATATTTITVLKAPQTITWPAPAPITYGTPLSAAQLNASVAVPGPSPAGDLTYTPAAGTVLHAGPATLRVTAAATANYTAATATVTLLVNKAVPVLTWAAPAAMTYGTPLSATQLDATAEIAGAFTYTPAAGTVLDAGSQRLATTFTPVETQDYESATAATTIIVNKAPQELTWATPASIVYGTPLSAAQLTAVVAVDGPAPAGTLTYTPAAGTILDNGAQLLRVTAAETTNYLAATQTVTLTIAKAPLTITATDATTSYGAAMPSLTGTLMGVVNNDPITPRFTTIATIGSPVGAYPIMVSLEDPANRARNYAVTATGATLRITPAPLVLRANDVTTQYSDPLPPFSATYQGFVLGETPAVLAGTLAFTTAATSTSAPGIYALTVGGVLSPNYAIQFLPGTVTVLPEDARVTFTGATMTSTTGLSTGTATVLLTATVRDVGGTSEAQNDASSGDIQHATLTFVDRATNAALCTATLGLIRKDDRTTATGTCAWTTPLVTPSTATIGIVVGGYYTRNSAADDVTVALQLPDDHFVTGGGYIVSTRSAGDLSSDPAAPISFTIDARYTKGDPLVHGGVTVQYQSTDATGARHTYAINASVLTSVAVAATQSGATMTAQNVTIMDVTDAKNPVSIATNASLLLTVSQNDKGHNGTLAVSVWKAAGGLWFSTNWNGSQMIEQPLDGGAIQIH